MTLEALDQNGLEYRRNNVADMASHLLRTHLDIGESLLPPAYIDYRTRVRRWREQLREAGDQLEIERRARRRANEIFEQATLAAQQLAETERTTGWQRVNVP